MHVRFVLVRTEAEGGLSLATRRLAQALAESGVVCDMLVPDGTAALDTGDAKILRSPALTRSPDAPRAPRSDLLALQRDLARGRPDLIVVSEGRADLVAASAAVAPTLLHAHETWPACPDATRYWGRLGRECQVKAGWGCAVLRPLLSCSGRAQILSASPIRHQHRLLEVMHDREVGTVAISGPQACLLLGHGIPEHALLLLPNLGMRASADHLARAASLTPPEDRSAVAFVGRLCREKGAALLPRLAQAAPALRVFGDGYLAPRLRPVLGAALRGHVDQGRIAGVLQWARAVVFPATWPEPGGITGIDAQLFGAPLGAFAVGAALDWPRAELFAPRDTRAMGAWAARHAPVSGPRSADLVAARQRAYWEAVTRRATGAFEAFVGTGRFPPLDLRAVTDDIGGAMAVPASPVPWPGDHVEPPRADR
jgi:glycosyltransferase involved in cell wall biosynthesis